MIFVQLKVCTIFIKRMKEEGQNEKDVRFMRKAIQFAREAEEKGEVPVGAVLVAEGQVIATGYNSTELLNDVTAHAEMLTITSAANYLGGKYLKKCTLYVTLEPCVMCAGALYWTQIDRVVFGAYDEKRGASRFDSLYHPKTKILGGILKEECAQLITDFFEKKR